MKTNSDANTTKIVNVDVCDVCGNMFKAGHAYTDCHPTPTNPPTETNEAPVKVPHLLPNKTLEGNYTPTEPTVETKEPSEDGSVARNLGEFTTQPDYITWDDLNYNQRHDFATSHGLRTSGPWQRTAEREYQRIKPTVEKWGGDQESNKCEFCGETKPVQRYYLRVKNKHFDDNKGGCYSTFIYYCQDCGVEDTLSVQEAKAEGYQECLTELCKKAKKVGLTSELIDIIFPKLASLKQEEDK